MVFETSAPATPGYSEWADSDGQTRSHYAAIADVAASLGPLELAERWGRANRQVSLDAFTFYLDPRRYRPTPTDWVPRVIPADHWEVISAGVTQRLKALNRFLLDLYNGTQDVVPDEVMYTSYYFYPEVQGFRPPGDVFVQIYGIDLVHLGDGRYVVLEDNLRIPSGITYQIKAVDMVSSHVPEFGAGYDVVPYDIRQAYHDMFRSLCGTDSPVCVLLDRWQVRLRLLRAPLLV